MDKIIEKIRWNMWIDCPKSCISAEDVFKQVGHKALSDMRATLHIPLKSDIEEGVYGQTWLKALKTDRKL